MCARNRSCKANRYTCRTMTCNKVENDLVITRHKTMNENERIKEIRQCDASDYPSIAPTTISIQ